MLEHLGYRVSHADSATAALNALANGCKVDVVFSDVMMPGGMGPGGEVRVRTGGSGGAGGGNSGRTGGTGGFSRP